MLSKSLGWAAVVAGLGLFGCSSSPREELTIRQAEMPTLYEGLPHPFHEAALLAAEKAKPTIDLHGFPFYRQSLALKSGDGEKLKAILEDADSYDPFLGEKKCGGFHPDFAVGWVVGGKQQVCLICFGCTEFKLYGPNGETRYDIASPVVDELKRMLASYRRNRPAP